MVRPQTIAHLLAPLDGSRLAESTLPAVLALASRLPARVTLLHVLERHPPVTVHGERHLSGAAEAEAYLHGVAARFGDAAIAVDSHAHPSPEGDVAASIVAHAAEVGAKLIVLCTHGRGGPRVWLSGSIAQRVVHRAGAPVLLVRPGADGVAPPFAPRTVLVALDGTPEGEAALPAALALALALGATLHLLLVVATLGTVSGDRIATARLTPAATSAALDLEADEARSYLARLGERLRATGVPVRVEVGRGDAARVVWEHAARASDGIVALATHGHIGLDAFWSGSVGTKVVAHFAGPLLLVHPQRPPAPGLASPSAD